MTKCKGCGKEFRKGSVAFLLTQHDGIKGARLCQPCVSGGVTIVAPKLPPVAVMRAARPEALDKALRQLRSFAGAAHAASKTCLDAGDREEFNFHQGRAAGFDGAIELIKREMT